MAKEEVGEKDQELFILLTEIKKLLVLNLLQKGLTTDEIGTALGVSYKTIERLVPRKARKKDK